MSPMNSRRTGCDSLAGIEVEDAAADAELPVLVDRVLRHEARQRQALGQVLGRDLIARRDRQADVSHARGRREPRQQRARRGDDQPGGAGREAVQRAGARRRDFQMRRQAAIRIDFLRRQRQDGARDVRVGQAFDVRQEEPRVGGHLLDSTSRSAR